MFSTSVYAQFESKPAYPVYGKIALQQKIIGAPETSVSRQSLNFEGQRGHAIGLGFGFEFGITEWSSTKTQWAIQSSLQLQSVPLKYSAYIKDESISRPVEWDYKRYAAGFEGGLGLIHQSSFKEKWDLRLGLAFNVQDLVITPSSLEHSETIGEDPFEPVTIVGGFFDPTTFNTLERKTPEINFTPVFTVGSAYRIDSDRQLIIDLKICATSDKVREPFRYIFGDGDFIYPKAYFGIDLAYRFLLNKTASIPDGK